MNTTLEFRIEISPHHDNILEFDSAFCNCSYKLNVGFMCRFEALCTDIHIL